MQASQLEKLHSSLLKEGLTELSAFIINSKIWHSQMTIQMLKSRVSLPVYQEKYDESIWDVLEGDKDDMFIYDRCGRLVEFIPFPHSILTKDRVKNAILQAYYDDPCGPCTVQKQVTTAPTTYQTEEMTVTTEASTSFNLTSKCQFDLERCDTILSDSYLANCCAQMFGNPEVIEESTQCINMTEKSCDDLQVAEDCCKEVKEQECAEHNESTCLILMENELQTDACCEHLQTPENVSDCENITSITCKEHKKNKLCCKQPINNHTIEEPHYHGISYNYTCKDYDEIKCASLDEEKNLIRCCENNVTDRNTVEDLNYDAVCHNVTKVPCESVQFALDCCNQVKNGFKINDSHVRDNVIIVPHNKSKKQHGQHHKQHGQHHKQHDHHHHHHQHDDKYPKINHDDHHKHRHHHGDINYTPIINSNIELEGNNTKYENSLENTIDHCMNISLEYCKKIQTSQRRFLRCCTESVVSRIKCRLIIPQCGKIQRTNTCCQNIFKQIEIRNKERADEADISTAKPQLNVKEQEDKSKLAVNK